VKYLKTFFENSDSKVEIIKSIIDEELDISYNKFNFKLDKENIDLEKDVIIKLIIPYWDKIKQSNDTEYRNIMNLVFDKIESELPVKEFFDKGNKEYKLHISCVIYKIFMVISNSK